MIGKYVRKLDDTITHNNDEYTDDLDFGGKILFKMMIKKEEKNKKIQDAPVGLGPVFLDQMDHLVLVVIGNSKNLTNLVHRAINLPHGFEPPLFRASCNNKIIDYIIDDSDENNMYWNKVLYL